MFKAWQQKRKGVRDADPTACWFTRDGILELFLILFVDKFEPYLHVKYSTNAMLLAIGNLSPQVVPKKQNLILGALIPGICHFFRGEFLLLCLISEFFFRCQLP